MKKSLRKLVQGGTSIVPASLLFSIGLQLRRVRLALPEKRLVVWVSRILDYCCCSFSPKHVMRRVPSVAGVCILELRVNDPYHYDLALGIHETVVAEWLVKNLRPGEVFLDLGANVGYYAILAAKFIGAEGLVIAVEADPEVAEMLAKNVEANHLNNNVRVVSGAVTDHTGIVRLGRAPASGWTGLYYGEPDEWVEVTGFTVDDLVKTLQLSRVDAVKIDVEGAEARVLKGMRATMTNCVRRLLIEVHRTHAGVEEEVLDILKDRAFAVKLLDKDGATMHVTATPSV